MHTSSLSELDRKRAEKILATLCEVPAHVRDQVRKGLEFEGSAIVLFESRPHFQRRSEWSNHPVAKFRFVKSRNVWQLYCQHRDLKWHAYQRLPETPDLSALAEEVRRDPTGIFWG